MEIRRRELFLLGYIADAYHLWSIGSEVSVTDKIDQERHPSIRRGSTKVVVCSGGSLRNSHHVLHIQVGLSTAIEGNARRAGYVTTCSQSLEII